MFTAATFQDPQGVTHDLAVFKVFQAHLRHDAREDFNINLMDETIPPNNSSTMNKNLNYQIAYWPSAAARDSGAPPYTLVNATNGPQFQLTINEDDSYDGLTAELAAEKHCQEVTLTGLVIS